MTNAIKPIFKELIQVGIVVSNLRRSINKYVFKYGVKPWYILKFSPYNVSSMNVRGERRDYSMNIGVCPIGDVRFELIEPLNESIYSEFNNKYSEGIIHHLKFKVDNYHEVLDYLMSNGIGVLQSGCQLGKSGKNIYSYLDTSCSLGFILEIVDVSDNFIKPKPDYWYPKYEKKIPNPVFKRPTQIGIVVKDLKEKVEYYTDIYGIKPWYIKRFNSRNVSDMYINGRMKNYSMEIAYCKVGNVYIKLIKPIEESIFSEFYDRYGEDVIHHLKMEVDNYKNTLDFFKSIKINVIQSGSYLEKYRYSFLSTNKDINYIVEIVDSNFNSNILMP